jgi:cell wall assembly regulator SMI1
MGVIWNFVEKLDDASAIEAFEKENKISFPSDLKKSLKEHNAGIPSKGKFDTEKEQERVINSLLSFNKKDAGNIYSVFPIVRRENNELLPFAVDVFGNYLCVKSGKIVLYLHETGDIEFVADSFTDLLGKLY